MRFKRREAGLEHQVKGHFLLRGSEWKMPKNAQCPKLLAYIRPASWTNLYPSFSFSRLLDSALISHVLARARRFVALLPPAPMLFSWLICPTDQNLVLLAPRFTSHLRLSI